MGEKQHHPKKPLIKIPCDVGHQDCQISHNSGLVVQYKLAKCFGFLRSLFLLARQRNNWSPFKILGELCRLFASISMLREILELLELPPFAEILEGNPRLAFKYVAPNYLVRGFTLTERVSCFLHHYKRIYAILPEYALRQVLQGEATLHEITYGVNCFALTMGLPDPIGDREGEMSLDLRVDGKKIFNLSFTIVPGWVVKSVVDEILLITRLQGEPGCSSQIKLACKAMLDYPPRGLLLAALEGIAVAFKIGEIEGVCATRQKSYTKRRSAFFENGYDDFFEKIGMIRTSTGFYSAPIPIKGKPLASFKGGARPRARKRRLMIDEIRQACAEFFLGVTDRAGLTFSHAGNSITFTEEVESRSTQTSIRMQDDGLNSELAD